MKKIFYIFGLLIISMLFSVFVYGDTLKTQQYTVYYENRMTHYRGKVISDSIYLPASMVGKVLQNKGISVDLKKARLNIDISQENIMLGDEQVTNFVKHNAGVVYIPLRKLDGKYYFPIDVVEQFFKVRGSVNKNKIYINYYSGTDRVARVSDDAVAVSTLENGSGSEFKLDKGIMVRVLGATENYYKIRTSSMKEGYILKDDIEIYDLDLSDVDFYFPQKEKIDPKGEKINLAWQGVSKFTPPAPKKYDGLDILAPTWFDLKINGDGSAENFGDKGYTDKAHRNGYKVWATVTNNMTVRGSTAFTTKLLADTNMTYKSIAQFLIYSALYDVDGINIDFEEVRDGDRENLVKYVKTMRIFTERQGLDLSIDVLIPAPWTIEYDRKELAKNIDYLCVMTYDEHYGGSKTPGSISSLPWTKKAIKNTIKEGVPPEKILMGIPLYTRVWCIKPNGKMGTRYAASMKWVREKIEKDNLQPVYLEDVGQNFVEYLEGSQTEKIWIEDETSIENRMEVIHDYDLAGACCWQYAFSVPEIWDTFQKYR